MPKEQLIVSMTVDDLRAVIRQEVSAAPPAYYSQDNSPLGHRRHIELCRTGKLRARRVGRSLFVRADDLHAYIDLSPPAAPEAERPKAPRKAKAEAPSAVPLRSKAAADLLNRARSV